MRKWETQNEFRARSKREALFLQLPLGPARMPLRRQHRRRSNLCTRIAARLKYLLLSGTRNGVHGHRLFAPRWKYCEMNLGKTNRCRVSTAERAYNSYPTPRVRGACSLYCAEYVSFTSRKCAGCLNDRAKETTGQNYRTVSEDRHCVWHWSERLAKKLLIMPLAVSCN